MSDHTAETSKFLPSLENAVNRKYFFLLAIYTLLVDSALIKIQGVGLLDYAQNPEGLKFSFALAVFLLFVLFSFVMALVMPGVSRLMNDTVLNFVSTPWSHVSTWLARQFGIQQSADRNTCPGMGYVSFYELRKKAHANATQEPYYLNLFNAAQERMDSEDETQYTTRFFAAAALVAATYNFYFLGALALLNRCTDFLGHRGWGWAFLFLIAGNAFGFLFTSHKTRWVYCPPLYMELTELKETRGQRV
jgi:hypothetical protein